MEILQPQQKMQIYRIYFVLQLPKELSIFSQAAVIYDNSSSRSLEQEQLFIPPEEPRQLSYFCWWPMLKSLALGFKMLEFI